MIQDRGPRTHGVTEGELAVLGAGARKGHYTVVPRFDPDGGLVSASMICARIRAKREFCSCAGMLLLFGPDRRLHSWCHLRPGRLQWINA